MKNEDFLFDFEKEIEEYCRSDVDIVRRCCLKFKELIGKTCGLDPFKCFRLQPSVPSTVPTRRDYWPHMPQGYQPARKYSVMALKWLSWVYHQTGNRIVHALNGGEQRIDGNFVDGYDTQRKTIYEFMGCIWHGCDECYMPDTLNPVHETSMENLLEGTIRKIERFKKLGYNVEVKWECEFKQ